MASNLYSKVAPDYQDGGNETGKRPGYLVEVVENDGGVGILMSLVEEDPRHGSDKDKGFRGVFLHVDDAQELASSILKAIDRAGHDTDHGWRVRER